MRRVWWLAALVLLVALAGALYIRLAPSDPARWHRMPEDVTPGDGAGHAMRVVEAGAGGLARLHRIVMDTPRTEVLAGSVAEGTITYVTRSAVMGFPDYTTVRAADGRIELYGRLRFGRSDFGVNAARLDAWLERFRQGR